MFISNEPPPQIVAVIRCHPRERGDPGNRTEFALGFRPRFREGRLCTGMTVGIVRSHPLHVPEQRPGVLQLSRQALAVCSGNLELPQRD